MVKPFHVLKILPDPNAGCPRQPTPHTKILCGGWESNQLFSFIEVETKEGADKVDHEAEGEDTGAGEAGREDAGEGTTTRTKPERKSKKDKTKPTSSRALRSTKSKDDK